MPSIFFSAGLGLGFVIGIAVGLGCWYLATRAAEAKYKTRITQLQQSHAVQRQALEQKVQNWIAVNGAGTNLSERHKKVLHEELSAVLTKPAAPTGR